MPVSLSPNGLYTKNKTAPFVNNLLALWVADIGRGKALLDLSGNGLHGSIPSGMNYAFLPDFGRVLDFDGSSYVTVGANQKLKVQSHSWAAWINYNAGISSPIIFARSNSIVSGGYEWAAGRSGGIAFAYYDGAVRGWYTDSFLLTNGVHLIGGAWNRTAGSVSFFVDGVLTSSVATPTNQITHVNTDNFTIGYQSGNNIPISDLYSLAVWNTVLPVGFYAWLYRNRFGLTDKKSPRIYYFTASSGGPVVLNVHDATVQPVLDNVTILPEYALTVQDLTVQPDLDNVALAPHYLLTVQDATVQPDLDNVTILPKYALTVQDLTVQPVIDSLLSASVANLEIQPSLDNVTILPKYALMVHELTVQPDLDNVAILPEYALTVQDLTVQPDLDHVTIIPSYGLILQNLDIVPEIENVVIIPRYSLTAQDVTIQSEMEHVTVFDIPSILAEVIKVKGNSAIKVNDEPVIRPKKREV